jgi:hypothetical protein
MAMQKQGKERDYAQVQLFEEVLRKHGVTRADFDSSLVYYYKRAERFDRMYAHVNERLDKQALALGATEGEIGKYSALKADGDTANIWVEKAAYVLMPMPPYHKVEFEIEADSTFKKGDSFLFQFMADYVYQNGSRDGVALVAITYDNDSIVQRQLSFGNNGLQQLHLLPLHDHAVKRIRGFFHLGGAKEKTTVQRLLFIDNIQFIRFHIANDNEQQQPETVQKDSVAPAADTVRTTAGTASGRDSTGIGKQLLRLHGGNAAN